jgi:hypothetical protein
MAMAMFDNINSVIADFIAKGCPYYMVSGDGMQCIWDNQTITDIHDASEKLRDELTNIRKGNSAIFTIKQFRTIPKTGLKKTSEPDYLSTYKQEYSSDGTHPFRAERKTTHEPMDKMLEMIMQQNKQLQTEIVALKMAQSQEDEEIESKVEPSSTIGAILGHPAIQQLLINIASNFVANTAQSTMKSHMYSQPTAMAGVDVEIENVFEQLEAKGVTMSDLQKLSEMPIEKIGFLLSMLRQQ